MLPEAVSANLKVAALVSIGQHPKSGRARRADQDARAVEMGIGLCGNKLNLVHAGETGSQEDLEQALRQYLGMGMTSMTVLRQPTGSDALPALVSHFRDHSADIILAGMRAESGEASGMLPYLLADRLGLPLVPAVAEVLSINEREAEVLQALPRGQRRKLKVTVPFIATVDQAAQAPRQIAFGPSRRGSLDLEASVEQQDEEKAAWEESPARKRPKRLNIKKAKTAADRFKAATAKPQGEGGRILKDESDREKAQAILDLLVSEGVIK
ncbi:electron transfer flavoprotein subunit beta [Hahella sp. CCB-MM4]|uniref:electron transfer flavoprotein subunit beta n=1 Tax=Hahella sp. (strain CCB-MM4) TaxID=1926491 RepID=UPI000B9B090B|nr:electron transfer flavoprotein subunit beta [Hahella sp. CCB-MM4]OZG70076.1 electron transfer flavoprotein subunit beta [Hahella sp. CCB-MM4]